MLKKVKISLHLARSPLVSFITKVLVLTNKPMKPKGYYISMFVCHAGPRMANLTLTHKVNVVRIQKTSNPGHDPGFESCP